MRFIRRVPLLLFSDILKGYKILHYTAQYSMFFGPFPRSMYESKELQSQFGQVSEVPFSAVVLKSALVIPDQFCVFDTPRETAAARIKNPLGLASLQAVE